MTAATSHARVVRYRPNTRYIAPTFLAFLCLLAATACSAPQSTSSVYSPPPGLPWTDSVATSNTAMVSTQAAGERALAAVEGGGGSLGAAWAPEGAASTPSLVAPTIEAIAPTFDGRSFDKLQLADASGTPVITTAQSTDKAGGSSDSARVTSTNGVADTRISTIGPSGQNRVYGPMYASAAGAAGGGITQGVTDQGSAWSDDSAWGYGDLAEWQVQTAAASAKDEEGEAEEPVSAQCAALARDVDADLGAVLKAGCKPTLAQMSALMDNPLGNVAMWINQYDFYKLENAANGKTADKHNYMGIIQFPKSLNEDWNLINRFVYNVPSMPLDQDKVNNFGDVAGGGGGISPPAGAALIDILGGRTTGFGDIYYVGLVAPKKPIKLESGANLLWAAGLDAGFPTASEDLLGTGKYLAGPTALGVYMGPKWKLGALVQHYWDYAGDDDRDDVNLTNLQLFYYYTLNETTSIGAGPNIIANWEQDSDNAFTVPVGIGINKTFQFGKVPVRIGAEIYYSVIQPDTIGTDWSFRFYVIPAVASALFDWMQ